MQRQDSGEGATLKQVGGIIESMRAGASAPSRHSNPYLQDALGLEQILLTASEVKERFPNIFLSQNTATVLEVGCYLGKNVLEFAQHNPSINFLGIDITYKRVVKSAKKIKINSIPNARIAICEARDFLAQAPDASLDGVCVFFPDPWPKKKHIKNRLVRQEFFDLLGKKLKPEGFLWLKTDSEPYFLEALESVPPNAWKLQPTCDGGTFAVPIELSPRPYVTSFEELFLSKGLPIYQQVFRRA